MNCKHCCINCANYDEFTCLAHSTNGCESHVRYPESYGTNCKDFEPYEDCAPEEEVAQTEEEEDWEW